MSAWPEPRTEQDFTAWAEFTLKYAHDPLGFVCAVFPWQVPGTPLENEPGPDVWQAVVLNELGQQLRAGVQTIRIAIASGHGTGKSTLMAWLTIWFQTCFPRNKARVTAGTMPQLKSATWREVAKWHEFAANRWQFEWTQTKYICKWKPNTWYAEAMAWSEHNSQAFAGLHEDVVMIQFDEACHDDQTEVLTADGWKLFCNVGEHDRLLTRDPATGVSSYAAPRALIRHYHDGELVLHEGRGTSICVTKKHRMWRASPNGHGAIGPWSFVEAGKLSKADHYMARHVDWPAADQEFFVLPELIGPRKTWPALRIPFDDWMRFLGWYGSEGHLCVIKGTPYGVGITQRSGVIEEILALCKSIWPNSYKAQAASQVIISSRQLGEWLSAYGRGCLKKRIPDCVRMASARQARIFLETYARGDGYVRGSGRTIIYTSSKATADDLQEIALKAGAISTIKKRALAGLRAQFKTHVGTSSCDGYVVSVQYRRTFATWTHKKSKTVPYSGWVYCADVPPHHLLMTRRNGYPIWSGNSTIADVIWDVSEGAFTTRGILLAFGNPTQPDGRFAECFGNNAEYWTTIHVDARDSRKANKELINQWIKKWGIDSDYVRVRVLGLFPLHGGLSFISSALIAAAVARNQGFDPTLIPRSIPLLMGVDVARQGEDQTVIRFRKGRYLLPTVYRLRIPDLMRVASMVAEKIREHAPDVVYVDSTGGYGAGVVDRLRQIGHQCIAVEFGSQADDPKKFLNRRAEIWSRMKDWIRDEGVLPDDMELKTSLETPGYGHEQRTERLQLESKKDIRSRGGQSPDDADSLAVTFTMMVPVKMMDEELSLEPDVV
jgi:hypothetical protein